MADEETTNTVEEQHEPYGIPPIRWKECRSVVLTAAVVNFELTIWGNTTIQWLIYENNRRFASGVAAIEQEARREIERAFRAREVQLRAEDQQAQKEVKP
jgi:hypothetical protein